MRMHKRQSVKCLHVLLCTFNWMPAEYVIYRFLFIYSFMFFFLSTIHLPCTLFFDFPFLLRAKFYTISIFFIEIFFVFRIMFFFPFLLLFHIPPLFFFCTFINHVQNVGFYMILNVPQYLILTLLPNLLSLYYENVKWNIIT